MFKCILLTLLSVNHIFANECGQFYPRKRQPEEAIITDYRAYTGLFPWIVSLQIKVTQNHYRHICSGAIIGHNWIVTAAYCVEDPDTVIERVNAGSLLWDNSVSVHRPEKIIVHSSSRTTSDIALVKITPSFIFKEGDNGEEAVGQICLPSEEQQFRGIVTLSGWNVNNASLSGGYSRELFAANMPIIGDLVCQQYSNIFSPGPYICTGPLKKRNKHGSCDANLGGPLVGIIKKKAYLVGIFSGINSDAQCSVTNSPIYYSKVSTFRKWVRINSGI